MYTQNPYEIALDKNGANYVPPTDLTCVPALYNGYAQGQSFRRESGHE